MADTGLQNTEESTLLEKVSASRAVHGLVQIAAIGGFVLTNLTIFAGIIGFLFAFPAYYRYLAIASIVGSALFTTSVTVLYLVFIRPKLKAYKKLVGQPDATDYGENGLSILRLGDAEPDGELRGNYQVVYAANERHKEKIETLESDIKNLTNEKAKLDKIVKDIAWLRTRAETERVFIQDHIHVESFDYIGQLEKMPGLCFMLTVRNASVYDIVIEKIVEGFLKYHGEEWTGTRITLRRVVGIESTKTVKFGLQYNLQQSDLDYFLANRDNWKDGDQLCALEHTNLHLTIRGAKADDKIDPQPLILKGIDIYDREKRQAKAD
ncbi:MAG: hypothetical protein ACKVRN_06045 [Pyrinomonadaceae bacterium]